MARLAKADRVRLTGGEDDEDGGHSGQEERHMECMTSMKRQSSESERESARTNNEQDCKANDLGRDSE